MEDKKVRVAITHGDTNGIGYELIFKTFAEPEMLELCTPIIYGSPKIAAYHRKALNMETNFSIINDAKEAKDNHVNLLTCFDEEVKVELGVPSQESGQAALKALDRAMTDYRDEAYDVLACAPVNDCSLKVGTFEFTGTSSYVKTCIGNGYENLNLLMNDSLRIAFLTDKISLKEVAGAVNKESIVAKATLLAKTLKRDFSISNPRIAVLALNPDHSANQPGKEEAEHIIPAIEELKTRGVQAFGPYPAEQLFGTGEYKTFDAVLVMYHDQGAVPFKALSAEAGILYTAGLPLICTHPDLCADFEHAGQGLADASSFRQAIFKAIDLFRHRRAYDEAYANPLQKLYREKRDESEKVRFSIPKKHENTIKETQKQ